MKVQIEIDVKPFNVPNFVLVESPPRLSQEGLQETQNIPLSSLDQATLSRMCHDFTVSVFKKAGVEMPLGKQA